MSPRQILGEEYVAAWEDLPEFAASANFLMAEMPFQ